MYLLKSLPGLQNYKLKKETASEWQILHHNLQCRVSYESGRVSYTWFYSHDICMML